MSQTINLEELICQIHVEEKAIVWHEYPFDKGKDSTIETFYRDICEGIKHSTKTLYQLEVNDYGSGYASYYDAWFYQESTDFAGSIIKGSASYEGLTVLFHRMLPYYVFMQGSKSWSTNQSTSCASYLPSRKMLDEFTCDAVKELAEKVEMILAYKGLIRLNRLALTTPLKIAERIPSVLIDDYVSYYDGLFYWED